MRFKLKTLLGVMTYLSAVLAIVRYFSIHPIESPIHKINAGLLQANIGNQLHDIELFVWVPVIMLVTYIYFWWLTSTSWKPRHSF